MDNFIYSNPVKLLFGKGQVDNVAREISPWGRKVLFVYGQKHIKETGLYQRITDAFKKEELDFIDLPGVHPNPRLSLVKEGIDICKNEKIDFILGVGGGSVSDTVKAIGIGAKLDYDVWRVFEDFHNLMHGNKGDFTHVPTETIPTGVVMTKPGTGSDFDYTSVLSNRDTKEKLMVINKVTYPKFSILDPELTFTLPQKETAFGTADMMTHIMEQYFTLTKNVEVLDRYKEANLKTVIEAGQKVKENPEDYHARGQLLYIAAWACSDWSMTGTIGGWDSHMIEHELSAATDLNHGHGMTIVYLGWMKYVIDSLPEKFARFAEKVWGVERKGRSDRDTAWAGIEKMREYWQSLGITTSLKDVNIGEDVLRQAAGKAVRFGPLGQLKKLGEEDVFNILESVRQ